MKAVVLGGCGGIGQSFVENLARRADIESVTATYHRSPPNFTHSLVTWSQLDISSESAIEAWAADLDEVDWLINAVGVLHTPAHDPEKSIRKIDPDFFLQSMGVNALPTLLIAKHTERLFRHRRPAIFAVISAKVGSIEDNRLGGWFSYRASKAALNMCLKTLSIEWQRTLPNVTVAALHPGTTNTALSKPFQKNVPKGQLLTPDQSVDYMLEVLDSLKPTDTGRLWAFDGELLPW